jgi:hypothetical protein
MRYCGIEVPLGRFDSEGLTFNAKAEPDRTSDTDPSHSHPLAPRTLLLVFTEEPGSSNQ